VLLAILMTAWRIATSSQAASATRFEVFFPEKSPFFLTDNHRVTACPQ
jgi:hypothetical protein